MSFNAEIFHDGKMTDYERIEKVIRYLDCRYLEQPSLSVLAKVSGLSVFHFHRLFTRWAGTTPKSFLKFLTAKHAKELLLSSRDLLSASLESGLSGPSRLHDLIVGVDAMTPGEMKSQAEGIEIAYGTHPTPFGNCLIGITSRGICYLSFTTNKSHAVAELRELWPKARFKSDQKKTRPVIQTIFGSSGKRKLSVVLRGTPFQLKVWEALLRIHPGAVLSYTDVADAIGNPGAARAVGTAVASNQVAYLIPCHRVIRETGILGEYRWGQMRKQAILGWEASPGNPGTPSKI